MAAQFQLNEYDISELFDQEFEEVDSDLPDATFNLGFDFGDMASRQKNIDDFLKDNQNKNTMRKTENDMGALNSFLLNKGEMRCIQFIPPTQLDIYLCEFLMSAVKKNGGEYEPCTLRSYLSSFERHLKEYRYTASIMTSLEFNKTRNVLKCKQKKLKQLGKGNKPNSSDPIDDAMLDQFYRCGTLGDSSPDALLHSMWLICTVHFGMRTGQETHKLRWGDISLKEDENGKYLLYDTERQTKTRTGANAGDVRTSKPRAYETDSKEKDPVRLYNLYKSKRPAEMMDTGSPFFLSVAHKKPSISDIWFKRQALGVNSLYNIMKAMMRDAGTETDRRITPYSVRKHLIQKLSDHGVPANQIVQISGHKNINSLNNYSKINPGQCKQISSILSNVPTEENLPAVPEPVPTNTLCLAKANRSVANQIPPMLSGNIFNAPVSFHFDTKTSLTQTQTTMCSPNNSDEPIKKWRRLRVLDSDSD